MLSTMRRSGVVAARVGRVNNSSGMVARNRMFSTATMDLDQKIAKEGFFRTASSDVIKGATDTAANATKKMSNVAEAATEAPAAPQRFLSGGPVQWGAFLLLNPFTLAGVGMYYRNSTVEELPYKAQVDSRNMTLQVREARRDSLKSFKEAVHQRDDPREHYDEATYRRNNYTAVVRKASFGQGLKDHKAKVAAEQTTAAA